MYKIFWTMFSTEMSWLTSVTVKVCYSGNSNRHNARAICIADLWNQTGNYAKLKIMGSSTSNGMVFES